MPVNKENNNESNFSNIKIIVLGALLATSIIGGLCYYFASNKEPSEDPTQEIIDPIKETQETEKQEEIIVYNEYKNIPVIDCLWLNILFFVIFSIIFIIIEYYFVLANRKKPVVNYFVDFFVIMFVFQVILYIIWFILMLIFAGFSKIWDKKHSWWFNVKKGFLRNRIYFKGDYFWTFWLLDFVVSVIIVSLIVAIKKPKVIEGSPEKIVVINNQFPENSDDDVIPKEQK